MPCSRQYSSQQALPIWTPAWPTWMEIHSRCTQRRHTGQCPAGPTHEKTHGSVSSGADTREDTRVSVQRGRHTRRHTGQCPAGPTHEKTHGSVSSGADTRGTATRLEQHVRQRRYIGLNARQRGHYLHVVRDNTACEAGAIHRSQRETAGTLSPRGQGQYCV